MRPKLESELTTHAHALRALARILVGDASADDLVQDTALAALQSPPLRVESLRGWLAQVLRRLASNHRRGEARRRRREHGADAPQGPEPAVRIAEHHDAVQRVTAALLALPEPYHGTVLLRFFEDLTPTAIAEMTGVPLATVKSRLQRALVLLREQLDAGSPGKEWRLALTAAFGLPRAGTPAVAAASIGTGVLLMGSGIKLAVAGVGAVVAAVAAFWLLQPAAPLAPSAQSRVVAAAPEAIGAFVGSPVAQPAAANERREVQVEAPSAPGPLATLRGRCVDEEGKPIAGVSVELRGWSRSSEDMDAWTKDHEVPKDIVEQLTTGSDGVFAFRFWPPPPLQFMVLLRHETRAAVDGRWRGLVEGKTKELGDVLLPRGVSVRGRVIDAEGAPVAKANIELRAEDRATDEVRPRRDTIAWTLDDGTFQTRWSVLPGDYRVRVSQKRSVRPDRLSLDGKQSIVDVTFVVDRVEGSDQLSISGLVLDDTDQPVAGARVALALPAILQMPSLRTQHDASTDGGGRFVLKQPRQVANKIALLVQQNGFEDLITEELAFGRDDVRLVLRRGLPVELSVVAAPDGAPVEDFQVRVFPDPNKRTGFFSKQNDVRARGHHPGGCVTVEGITRGDWCVLVEPKGDLLAMSGFVPVRVADPGPARVTVALPRRIERPLRVQFADGSPVAGTRVQLGDMRGDQPSVDTRAQPLTSTLWTQGHTALLLHEAVTDARGEARLRGPQDRLLAVFVRGPGHVPFVQGDVRFDGDGPLVVTVSRGARVTGKVSPAAALAELRRLADLPETGAVDERRRGWLPGVRLVRVEPRNWLYHPDTSCVVAEDGSFAIEGAAAGRWDVTVNWCESSGDNRPDVGQSYIGKSAVVASVELRDEATTAIDLDLAFLVPGELDALVLHNDKPAARRSFSVSAIVGKGVDGSDEEYQRLVTTDADGRFRLRMRPGSYEIIDFARRTRSRSAERALVVAGQNTTQTFRVHSGELRLRLLDAQGDAVRGQRIEAGTAAVDGAMSWCWLPPTDADGRTTVEADAIPVTLAVLPKRFQDPRAEEEFRQQNPGKADPFDGLRVELGRTTPKPGATIEVELRLPTEWLR